MDHQRALRRVASHALPRAGSEVTPTFDGDEAVDCYGTARAQGRCLSAVVVEMTAPVGMDGRETAQRILALEPFARPNESSGGGVVWTPPSPAAAGFMAC